MKILVTGAAGFIGFHTCLKLLDLGHEVYGIDNINDYYEVNLKYDRLKELGLTKAHVSIFNNEVSSEKYRSLRFSKIDISDYESLKKLFEKENFEVVCNLAAQAGVRYSIENPKAYIESNISGFFNILEVCRNYDIQHLVYASSSSVYGQNEKVPFSTTDNVDHPISLYAATKKSNELMAHTYGHLYGFKTTGLRFFTVYGPWGRPDMAYFLFANAIAKNQTIKVFNNGEMERDFTFIDDVVNGVAKVIEKNVEDRTHYKIYNIGNNKVENLENFISTIEDCMQKKADREMYPMQLGDVTKTYADINELKFDFDYKPKTNIKVGIKCFIDWYLKYYKL
ncbi:MAG: NAD-dependent epimerase/dehydratase family protein [Bacteroidota bacterium]|nr:NAD-dependent epimerase/dehydratase family protein [Bacteroidota bacterium]